MPATGPTYRLGAIKERKRVELSVVRLQGVHEGTPVTGLDYNRESFGFRTYPNDQVWARSLGGGLGAPSSLNDKTVYPM
jgi:hypothetical protein